jgi:hypothetical protein
MLKVLFNPWFLAILGAALVILKLTHVIDISWVWVVLPFFVRPIAQVVIALLMGILYAVATKQIRKNVKEGDRVGYRNLLNGVTNARVEKVEGKKALIKTYGGMSRSSQWIEIDRLLPPTQ